VIIHTGWWCEGETNNFNREKLLGDDTLRRQEFHNLWYQSICAFTNPDKILIVDSNSPIKPKFNKEDDRIELLSLPFNAGHATDLKAERLAGVSRSFMLGILYALMSDVEYYVYIEQDALLFGKEIIEHCIRDMQSPYMFGNGKGTPQITQQSLFIIHRRGMQEFINNYLSIQSPDNKMTSETKFCLAANKLTKLIPNRIILSRLWKKIYPFFVNYDLVPIGYGRTRPINFKDPYFYFQHGNKEEIKEYLKLTGFKYEPIENE
jgi:hypothetical protein